MGLDLGGVGGGNGYDQTTVYGVCKELIKISFKERLSTQHKSVISIKYKQHSPQNAEWSMVKCALEIRFPLDNYLLAVEKPMRLTVSPRREHH